MSTDGGGLFCIIVAIYIIDGIWLDKTKKNHTRKPLNLEKKVGFFGDFPKKIVIILLPVWCPLPIKN